MQFNKIIILCIADQLNKRSRPKFRLSWNNREYLTLSATEGRKLRGELIISTKLKLLG